MTNNDASYYCSQSGVKTGWLQYDFASPQQVKTYKIEQINGASRSFGLVLGSWGKTTRDALRNKEWR